MAQEPLYFVNGRERAQVKDIDESDIEHIETLTADEATVAKYGTRASGGVVLITLKYDTAAAFESPDSTSFSQYVARRIKWDSTDPVARVVLRYSVTESGKAEPVKVLESTDKRLERKVLAAMGEAPHWTPATKNGKNIATEKLLRIQLPEGKAMPRQKYVVLL